MLHSRQAVFQAPPIYQRHWSGVNEEPRGAEEQLLTLRKVADGV